GGHVYKRQGRGAVPLYDCTDQYYNDSAKSLQFLTRWVDNILDTIERDI
ncbi:1353_t:CDS:1, partial [Racocetra persica]